MDLWILFKKKGELINCLTNFLQFFARHLSLSIYRWNQLEYFFNYKSIFLIIFYIFLFSSKLLLHEFLKYILNSILFNNIILLLFINFILYYYLIILFYLIILIFR